ncbi:embryonic polarity protein dorsal-like, partial [Euwallacea fornicatus]|uniref:embryonic polarity protein dorsal-like n=1 Tax=Euwallacea fornicatus TaxID=995702 RepID=UPI0033903AB3
TPFWSFKGGLTKKPNYSLFDSILANDVKLVAKRQLNSAGKLPKSLVEANNNDITSGYAEVKKTKLDDDVVLVSNSVEEKSFNEIINQVAELDEIYSDTHAQIVAKMTEKPPMGPPHEESFDDARTYTSLQLAFKNPVAHDTPDRYEDVIVDPLSPKNDPKAAIMRPAPLPPKRDNDPSLPPLPPKRTKKLETYIGGSTTSIQLTGKQADILLTRSGSMRSTSVSRTQSFNLQRPKSQGELVPPGKRLPPVPNASATLPNPKKRSFFSKLFGRRSSKCSAKALSREASVTPSYNSTRSLQVDSALSKSSGNISTHSSNSIRIRLKDDSPPPITESEVSFPLYQKPTMTIAPITIAPASLPPMDVDADLQMDLTEAENYALYTTMAPHATQSEFDEFSCYYAPVEGGKLLTGAEVAARLAGRT